MKYYLICLISLFYVINGKSIDEKCCEICKNDTVKYYSIPLAHKHNCGESCIFPKDFIKYKIFEPALKKANSSYPCREFGFTNYINTETHGFGNIKIDLDLYTEKG